MQSAILFYQFCLSVYHCGTVLKDGIAKLFPPPGRDSILVPVFWAALPLQNSKKYTRWQGWDNFWDF